MVPSFALAGGAVITVVNFDGPNEGFNDPTVVTPVGGNPGTTLGAQRLNAFQRAADIWGATLDDTVQIQIAALFDPLNCNATAATLGSAGAWNYWYTTGNEFGFANTWHHVALANKQYGQDLSPTTPDIVAQFNSSLGGTNPNGTPCFTGGGWYLGLDGNKPAGKTDLITVLLHEFAHGLGFASPVNKTTGAFFGAAQGLGMTDVYLRYLLDNTTNTPLDLMSTTQRAAAIGNGASGNNLRVAWTGSTVNDSSNSLLADAPTLTVNSPASIAGKRPAMPASFGPALTVSGVTGTLVLATDAVEVGGTSTDGCSAFTTDLNGKIAFIDRGFCSFAFKVKNAQNAGAIGVIIVNNTATTTSATSGFPGMGPDATVTGITIPSLGLTLIDGNLVRAQLASGVNVTLQLDPTRGQGTDGQGRLLTYTSVPMAPGSSISHWDVTASPNLLMEPFINNDLSHGVDLTLPLLRDIGWFPDADLDVVSDEGLDQCLASDLRPTINIDSCDSGVSSAFSSATGCTRTDLINRIAASASNHGDFVSGVSQLANHWKKSGEITGAEQAAIVSCAAHSN